MCLLKSIWVSNCQCGRLIIRTAYNLLQTRLKALAALAGQAHKTASLTIGGTGSQWFSGTLWDVQTK